MYGFYTKDEREMFRQLIGVTRIGKKIALNLLSLLSPNEIVFAVQTDNEKAFDKVSGMGKKSAQRLILELKEKVEFLPQADGEANEKTENDAKIHDAIEALISLGYDGAVAGRAVGAVKDFNGTEDLIKKALLIIAKK